MVISTKRLAAYACAIGISLGGMGSAIACPYTPSQQYGGTGGGEFSDNLTQSVQISEIKIWSGSRVDAIQTTWKNTGGGTFTGEKHGGSGGGLNVITLKDGEYITRIDGRSGSRVDQLTFTTNLGNKFGPFGGNGGSPFTIANVNVGGFLGRSGSELDAVAVFNSVK